VLKEDLTNPVNSFPLKLGTKQVNSKRNQLRETQAEYHTSTNSVTVKTADAASLIREGLNAVSVPN
jgi:hypothetical protein